MWFYNVAGDDTLCMRVHWPFGVSLKETMLLSLSLSVFQEHNTFLLNFLWEGKKAWDLDWISGSTAHWVTKQLCLLGMPRSFPT